MIMADVRVLGAHCSGKVCDVAPALVDSVSCDTDQLPPAADIRAARTGQRVRRTERRMRYRYDSRGRAGSYAGRPGQRWRYASRLAKAGYIAGSFVTVLVVLASLGATRSTGT